jgi:hypothetical protein
MQDAVKIAISSCSCFGDFLQLQQQENQRVSLCLPEVQTVCQIQQSEIK